MKFSISKPNLGGNNQPDFKPIRQGQDGTAVIIMLALLSIILVYAAANIQSLSRLDREIKLVDQRQVRRWNALSSTNAAFLAALTMADTNAPATNGPVRLEPASP